MQDILVYVRDFQERTPAAYYGARLATALGASITGMYACPAPVYSAPAYEPELMSAIMENTRKLVSDALEAKTSFLDWAVSMGVAQAEWLVTEGNPTDALVQAATRHDLLILDHPVEGKGSAWDIPGLVLKVGAPCIVLPRRGWHYEQIERVAIGWNGSPEAMRAVHAALPFVQGKQVLLMRGDERPKYPEIEWYPPFDIEAYLQRRNVSVVPHTITAQPDDAGQALLEEAMRFRADLLVVGAYGRSRFSEWMLGGATRDVLTWADLPLFMRH
jgi:nucleotide-binding universal stress UspA family protein